MHVHVQANLYQLADFYVEGNYTVPPAALAALSRRNVNNGNLTLSDFADLCAARIQVCTA